MSKLNLFFQEKAQTSARNDRIAARIKECLSMTLARGDFPVLPGHKDESKLKAFVTITHVNLSPDLRNATIFFSTLNEEDRQEALNFFNLQEHFFKSILAKKLKLRFIPDLVFKLDETLNYYDKIDKILKKI